MMERVSSTMIYCKKGRKVLFWITVLEVSVHDWRLAGPEAL
jgi:hypothetical protein